jgi:multidrug efflux system membrane fusion protein
MTHFLFKSILTLAVAGAAVAADRQFDLVTKASTLTVALLPGSKATANSSPEPTSPLRSVRIVAPKAAADRFGLTLPGRTVPLEQTRLSGRATGVVVERHGEIGDRVRAGDVLVVIDAPEISQQLDRARAAVEQVKARLTLAELTLDRAQELVPKKFLPEQARDDRQANVAIAKADLEAAQAEVRRLQDVQGFQTIRAPFDGVIIERQVERGDRVNGDLAAAGSYFYNVARLEQLRVEIDVPQSFALKVQPGTSAKMTFAELPDTTFDAKVMRISQAIDQTSGTMRAELVMDNANLMLPAGLTGQVLLDIERDAPCVLVPGNALMVRQGQQFAAIARADDTIEFRAVRLGRDLGNEAEICSGLQLSDRVILSPNALLKAGDKVDVVKPTKPVS